MKIFPLAIQKAELLVLLSFTAILFGMIPASPEEGMYPLSEIDKVDLVKAGLKIDPKEIYNPGGTSLIDALVNIGGCTGSFISEKGLIITNHHCAFGVISVASTVEKNYLENGFHAANLEEEIPARGITCKITESYRDVSTEILSAVANITDPAERVRKISAKMKKLAEANTNEKESIVAEVSEMFAGKSYLLFTYRIIRDVRLVYAPPQSIGNFGSETDNWVWPRQTGDFSLMRAYVAPDGSAREYSKENVPFKPKKFLKVNASGIDEGDFVFILGYPGRTFRHRPSFYLEYQQKYLLPYISEHYAFLIDEMEKLGKNDPALKLKYASRVKGLANTMKNYRGKLKGLKKIDLILQKKEEEKMLAVFINSDPNLKSKYGNLFGEIEKVYKDLFSIAESDLWFRQAIQSSTIFTLANFTSNYITEMQKPDSERKTAYQEKNINSTMSRLNMARTLYHKELERNLLRKVFNDAVKFSDNSEIVAITEAIDEKPDQKKIDVFIDDVVFKSVFADIENFPNLISKPIEELKSLKDPLFDFVNKLQLQAAALEKTNTEIEGKLNKLFGELVDVKMEWKKTNFIPDANSTLRLTYGYIKGYSPADALYAKPQTTIDGIIEKNSIGTEDFRIPDKLRELYDRKDFGKYIDKDLNSLPVAMLYNMDTTGGNSGSPILNAYGELVGVNFDRAYEATINDFAWNEAYSRSIGVDIRYVLWVMDKFSGASNLLKEIGI